MLVTYTILFLILLTVGDGLCSTAEKEPILFGYNSTAGCLLPVSLQNLTQCDSLRSVCRCLYAFVLCLYVFLLK